MAIPNFLRKIIIEVRLITSVLWSCLLFLLISCENDLAEVSATLPQDAVNREVLEDFHIIYSDSAKVLIRAMGPLLYRYLEREDPREEFPKGIHILFFDANSQVLTSRLSANYGVRKEKDSQVVLRDSVVWISEDGNRLETEELIWDEKKEKVYTNKFVVVRSPERIIYGHGFEANRDFTASTIWAVEGEIRLEE
ncbi:MAG TPA: LPS export ABC transporter periplasmic protein LptC [Phaeodactylibacter sp.]|nr:LPS export ABC transporter periplasmic protein LptC [Phaeodactylibacter sp.]